MQRKKDIVKTVLLGQVIRVMSATNESLVGLSGRVIDETKNMIVLDTGKSTKKLIKEQVTIKINNHMVDGKLFSKTIQERIKS